MNLSDRIAGWRIAAGEPLCVRIASADHVPPAMRMAGAAWLVRLERGDGTGLLALGGGGTVDEAAEAAGRDFALRQALNASLLADAAAEEHRAGPGEEG